MHIILFENFNNQLYQQCSVDEYYRYCDTYNTETFTDNQLLSITNILKPYYKIERNLRGYIINIEHNITHTEDYINKYSHKITYKISRFEDEIYFIEYLKESQTHQRYDVDGAIYMCDQIDGLLQYIKEKGLPFIQPGRP